MNSFQNPQNDYSVKKQDVIPSYRFSKLYQQTGGQTLTIDTSAQESIFELPTKCMNLSRSFLKCVATVPGDAFTYMFNDCMAPIRQIQLYTRGGVFLADVNHVSQFTKVALKTIDKDDLEYSSRNSLSFGAKSNLSLTDNYRHSATSSQVPDEPKYFQIATGNDVANVLNIDIPLSSFQDTILGLDKDLFFGEVVLLKVTWNDYVPWGFSATAGTNAVTGAAALAADIPITKLSLHLALESNPVICNGLVQQVQTTGLEMIIPYVYSFRNTPGAAGTGGIQIASIRLNGAHGRYCKKIYHTLFPATETLNNRYSLDNTGQTQIISYHTNVDNVRRQEFDLVTADGDDWTAIRHHLKGTPIESVDAYRYNWFVLDKFDDECPEGKLDCVDSGMSLAMEHKWDFVGSCGNTSFNHYTFAVVSRRLAITPQGLMIGS